MKHDLLFKREQPLQLRPGNLCRRLLTARVLAHVRRQLRLEVAAELWPNDRTLAEVIKATSAPAMTAVTGWALELAQTVTADTVEALGAASGAMEVLQRSLVLNWDGAGTILIPAFVASAANAGFVAEGDPIPVRQLSVVPKNLVPRKVASIAVLTREMLESSNAEALIGDTLMRSAALAIDAAFFDSAAANSARPAGIRNGISTTTASNNADPFAAFAEDMATLLNGVSAVGGKGPYVIAANAGRVISASLRIAGGAIPDVTTVMASVAGNDLIAIAPQAIACAFAPEPDVETANAGTLVMDTAPVAVGSTGPERELFQTDSLAIKMRWPVSWVVRNASGVAWTTPTWK